MKACLIIFLAALAFIATTHLARASNVIWVNTNGGNWNVANNWNAHNAPHTTDTAIITNAGTYTVNLSAGVTVSNLVLGTAGGGGIQTLSVGGQTLTLGRQATVNSSGALNGDTNSIGMVFNGTLNCAGGAMSGKCTLASNAVLNLSGPTNPFNGLILFTNHGTVHWSNVNLYGSSSLQVFNQGLWDAQSNNTFYGSGTVFNNSSTFRKSAGGGTTTLDTGTSFNTTGTVDVESGTMAIQNGTGGGTFTNYGIINFGSNSGFTISNSASFNGAGLARGWLFGTNAILNGEIKCSALELSGTMSLSTNSVLNFVGTFGANILNGFLINYGVINWSNVDLTSLSGSQTIINYGVWDCRMNNTINASSGTVNFYNYGTLRKSGGLLGSGQTYFGINNDFRNYGTIDCQIGYIQFNGLEDYGTVNVAANAVCSSVMCSLNGSPTFSGSGYVEGALAGYNCMVNGLLTLTNTSLYGTLTFASNTVVNCTSVSGAGGLFFSGSVLTNYGTVVWSNEDMYNSSASQIYNYGLWDAQANNTFYGGSGTTFNNYGTLRKSGGSLSGNPTVTWLDTSTTFNNFGTVDVQVGGLDIASGIGSGVFNSATNSELSLDTYTLTGDPNFTVAGIVQGDLTVNNATLHGALRFDNGSFSGSLTIASNSTLVLMRSLGNVGPNDFPIGLNAIALTNYGTINWSNVNLNGSSSPQIYNYGLWDVQSNNTFYGAYSGGGTTTFNNYGTFRKSGGDNTPPSYVTLFDNSTIFNNFGTVDAEIGFLDFGTGSDSGLISTANSGFAQLANFVLTGTPTFSGPAMIDGALTGSNAVLRGSVTLTEGTLSGILTVASNATVNVGIDGAVIFSGIFTNYGTVDWPQGMDSLYGESSPQIYNYGLWDAQANNTFYGAYNFSGTTTFYNYGTFRKSGGNVSPPNYVTFFDNSTIFNNFGTVDAEIGVLDFGSGSDSGVVSTTTNGFTQLANFVLTGNPSFGGPAMIAGSLTGSNAVLHGSLALANGTLSGVLTVASNATVDLGSGGAVIFSGNFTNYGTVNWPQDMDGLYGQSSPQIYNYGLWDAQANNTLYGAYSGGGTTTFNNYGTFRKSGGTVNDPGTKTYLDSSTIFNNPGNVDVQVGLLSFGGNYSLVGGTLNFDINSSNDFGSISLNGNAALTGALSVNFNNGYSPAANNSFPVVSYGSETGTFTSLNLPQLPSALSWQTSYSNTVFTLSIVPASPLQLSAVTVNVSSDFISFSWEGQAGQTYLVQCTTNLAPANWVNLGDPTPGTYGTMTVSNHIDSIPQKFYRLGLQ